MNVMAVDNKTIGISGLVSLGIVLMAMITPGFFDEPQYYCESRPELGLQTCDSFSKYVDPNGKCVIEDAPNLICRDGWKLVTNDMANVDEPDVPVVDVPMGGSTGQKYTCHVVGWNDCVADDCCVPL